MAPILMGEFIPDESPPVGDWFFVFSPGPIDYFAPSEMLAFEGSLLIGMTGNFVNGGDLWTYQPGTGASLFQAFGSGSEAVRPIVRRQVSSTQFHVGVAYDTIDGSPFEIWSRSGTWTLEYTHGDNLIIPFCGISFNEVLYFGTQRRNFPNPAKILTSSNGSTWSESLSLNQFELRVESFAIYNGVLYAAFRRRIYYLDSGSWILSFDPNDPLPLSPETNNDTFYFLVLDIKVFNSLLYAVVRAPTGEPEGRRIYTFNGSTWTHVDTIYRAGTVDTEYYPSSARLEVYDNKLWLATAGGTNLNEVWVLVGSTWTVNRQFTAHSFLGDLITYPDNNKLYLGQRSSAGEPEVWVFPTGD